MAIYFIYSFYYRPQRSWGKVIFSQARVILFTGGLPQCMLGYQTLPDQTPLDQAQPPPDQAPPGSRHPPMQCMLEDTVNERAVRILLECNLVFIYSYLFYSFLCAQSRLFKSVFLSLCQNKTKSKKKVPLARTIQESLSIFTNSSQIFRLKRHTTGS